MGAGLQKDPSTLHVTAVLPPMLPVCMGIFLFVPINAFQVPFSAQMCCINKKTGEYHRRTGMLFLMSGKFWKLGAEWYLVANNPALNETNSFDLLEGKVLGSLT